MTKPYDVSTMTNQEIRFLTKPMCTYDNTLIDQNELRRHIHLSNPLTWTDPKTSYCQIGKFGVLPPEILFRIFKYTTIDSLMHLRTTNSSFKTLIEAWPTFRTAMLDAQSAVAALIATKASTLWTFSNLKKLIYTSTCHYCKQHGEILHLLKLKRVCFNCVTTRRELLAVDEQYVKNIMRLSQSEIQELPRLTTIPQRSYWGTPNVYRDTVIDYTAALKLAKVKWRSPDKTMAKRSQGGRFIELEDTKFVLADRLTRRNPPAPVQKSINRRRNADTPNDFELPHFLVDPAESLGIQHACCVHFPALHAATRTTPPMKINALLCAGCSFYYNYHNTLPYQAHTLYPHTTQPLRGSQSRIPQSATSKPTTPTDNSPLHTHLQSCIYAQTLYKTLYPALLLATPDNPRLASNGGTLSPQALNNKLRDHVLSILAPSTMQQRHFPRHPIDSSGIMLTMRQNNEHFEMISLDMLEAGHERRKIRCATGLELELEEMLRTGKDKELIQLLTRPDEEFDLWTQQRLQYIRAHTEDEPEYVVDTIGDVILSTSATVSQANWALARPSSSMNLFGNWKLLLMERKRKVEESEQRICGGGKRTYCIGGGGWGFDRFGCISEAI